jgi:hypothetical protein
LIRQLFHIKQNGSVSDYVEQFAQLVEQLAAYTSTTDPLDYTLRFIDGLKEDIKSIFLVQRPQDLVTTCVLASLQEEVGDVHRRRDCKKLGLGYHSKQSFKKSLPLPAPTLDKTGPSFVADDTRGMEAARAGLQVESKAEALRNYKRAMGLCFKCNEKWGKDHKFAPIVQLHVVQELWDLFQSNDDSALSPGSSNDSSEYLFMAISKAALSGCVAPKTVKFKGSIQHQQVSLLIDSGSSSSFISSVLADKLSGVVPLSNSVRVQVAGGGILSCSAEIPHALSFIGDIAFQTDLRVLPLTAYDVIIGTDWLESYSPMKIHWKNKWMEIPYGNQLILLQGEAPISPKHVLVQLCVLSDVTP